MATLVKGIVAYRCRGPELARDRNGVAQVTLTWVTDIIEGSLQGLQPIRVQRSTFEDHQPDLNLER